MTKQRALGYQNYEVVSSFADKYKVSIAYAKELFEETKKWLWVCAQQIRHRPNASAMEIYFPLLAIDEMWHTFILHTKSYDAYCREYLGQFIHHNPTSVEEKENHRRRTEQEPVEVQKEILEKLSCQLRFVEETLGPDSLIKWYGEEELLSLRQLEKEKALYAAGSFPAT